MCEDVAASRPLPHALRRESPQAPLGPGLGEGAARGRRGRAPRGRLGLWGRGRPAKRGWRSSRKGGRGHPSLVTFVGSSAVSWLSRPAGVLTTGLGTGRDHGDEIARRGPCPPLRGPREAAIPAGGAWPPAWEKGPEETAPSCLPAAALLRSLAGGGILNEVLPFTSCVPLNTSFLPRMSAPES